MGHQISEADWKVFRQLHAIALERYSQRVLDEVARVTGDSGMSYHARYQKAYRLMEAQGRKLANAFDDLRRSTALRQLAIIRSLKVLTDDEFARFSPETRSVVELFLTG